jgi:virulence factor Mce-like protein
MTKSARLLELAARLLVTAVRAMARQRAAVAVVGLVVTLVVASTYIAVWSLGLKPGRSTIAVRVLLPESGGLLPDQDVTLRGVPIGRVSSVNVTSTGVVAVAALGADIRIPQNSQVRVSPLSAAGEQYLDFSPRDDHGPMLRNGSIIDQSQTSVPVPLSRLLVDADGALAQLNPQQLAAVTDELRVGHQGPQKLAALLDGGAFLISTLDSVLPHTARLIRNSKIVLTTLGDVQPGLHSTSLKLQHVLGGISAMDRGFRTLVDRGDAPMTALDDIIADNSDTMVQLLGNLTTIAQVSVVHVPALTHLFNPGRGSVLDAFGTVFHGGALWAIADIYPRYGCDYKLPRYAPSQPDFVEPYLYTYCDNPDPAVLVRGARNAPRPPGDDTAGPPPGYDPLAKTDPTPVGPHSIPTQYGGPQLPLTLPPGPPIPQAPSR